jgi:hypothetical protein
MKVFYKAPNNVSVVKNPVGPLLVDQNVHSISVSPDRLLLVARLLKPQATLAVGANDLLVWWLDHEEQDALLYGVDPTGAADSLAALDAVTRAAIAAGGAAVKLPRRGLIQLSAQWLVGHKFVDESEVGYGFGQVTSYDAAPSYSHDDWLLAAVIPTVPIKGRGSILWWGGAEPSTEKALLHYAMPTPDTVQAHVTAGSITDLCFAGPAAFSGGVLQSPDSGLRPTTKVSGLFVPGSSVNASQLTARECKRGINFNACYWSTLEKSAAWHCDRGFTVLNHNSSEASNLKASYCRQGFELTGQGATFRNLGTEQCGQVYPGLPTGVLAIPEGDSISIDGVYLESVGATIKDYTYRFGLPENLALYSEQFNQSGSWGAVSSGALPTVTADAGVAPDGTTTADTLNFTVAVPDGGAWDYYAQQVAVTVGQTYTFSVWLKRGASSPATNVNIQARISGGAGDATHACALTTDWQRFEVSFTPATGATAVLLCIGDSGTGPFTITPGSVLVWGAMMNKGGFAKTYRKTGSAAVAAGNGVYFLELRNAHSSSEQGASAELVGTQLLAHNSRPYDQGSEALRAVLDGNSSIISNRSNVATNATKSENGASVQSEDRVIYGMAWIHTGGDADSEGILSGRCTHRDLTGYTGVKPNDEVLCMLGNLPTDWLARAECITAGTIRLTLFNGSGSTGDVPTMTGTFHCRNNHLGVP